MRARDTVQSGTIVIAHFSKTRAYTYALCGLTVLGLLIILVLNHPAGTTLRSYLDSKGLFRYQYAQIALVSCSYLIVKILIILYQLLFREQWAIWVVDSKLRYINFCEIAFSSSVKIDDIESVTLGTSAFLFAPTAIVFRGHSGDERKVPAWFLSEPVAVILKRLEDFVALR